LIRKRLGRLKAQGFGILTCALCAQYTRSVGGGDECPQTQGLSIGLLDTVGGKRHLATPAEGPRYRPLGADFTEGFVIGQGCEISTNPVAVGADLDAQCTLACRRK
jgi:hypothetical protein